MSRRLATRIFLTAAVASAACFVSPGAAAQAWLWQGGVVVRGEYNDNYFFTAENQSPPASSTAPADPESAFTASVIPFVTAARRTENSDVIALLAVGGNKVWGSSSSTQYLTGRFVLDGSLREARSTWAGNASFTRSAELQNAVGAPGAVLALAYTNAAAVAGNYSYSLTERSMIGAFVGAYDNRYQGVQGSDTFSDNHGYTGGGNLEYTHSDRTRFAFAVGYAHYTSDVTRNNSVTTTLGVVHRFSPELTISASVGWFWSDATPAGSGPLQSSGEKRRESDGLFGGSMTYAFSERTRLGADLSESLAPNGAGALSKSDTATATLLHEFSDRLTGRLGASFQRTAFPGAFDTSQDSDTLQGQVGFSYKLAERWRVEAGYVYTRASYSQNLGEPKSNLVFVSIGYNWPGASFTGWVGRLPEIQGFVGAAPLTLPEGSLRPPTSESPPSSPFDRFALP